MIDNKIIICRHAESLEDVNNSIYDIIDDLNIPLTRKGIQQAVDLGKNLNQLLQKSRKVIFFTSPGLRNIQTMEYVKPYLPTSLACEVKIEPLIVKQDWGDINSINRPLIEEERYLTGVLRYKFPTGESAYDMISRIRTFRNIVLEIQNKENIDVVVLSHGFEFRVFLMTILNWEEEYFESLANVGNCEYRILIKGDNGQYLLNEQLLEHGHKITRLSKAV